MAAITAKSLTGPRAARLQQRQGGAGREPAPSTVDVRVLLVRLSTLLHRRWSVPVLAELARGDLSPGGAKFVTLANRLEISRGLLRQTLDHLVANDYVMRNPGVGHPMRPEYLLAEDGYAAAPRCVDLLAMIRGRQLRHTVLNKWSLPIVLALGDHPLRFSELKSVLPSVTARALTMALKDLVAAGFVARQVLDDYPPTTSYRLTSYSRRFLPILRRIASSGL